MTNAVVAKWRLTWAFAVPSGVWRARLVADGGGLENRYGAEASSWVRIPRPPPCGVAPARRPASRPGRHVATVVVLRTEECGRQQSHQCFVPSGIPPEEA